MTPAIARARPAPFLQLDRLKALVDGVLAIVLTILVLELDPPATEPSAGATAFLVRFWHQIHPYAGSFAITTAFWVQHTVILHYVARANRAFVWLNLSFLFPVTLLPFMTELRLEHGAEVGPAMLIGGVPAVAGLLLLGVWRYASAHRRLISPRVDPAVVRSITVRLALLPVLCVLAGALSPVDSHLTTAVFAMVLLASLSHRKADEGWADAP